MKEYDLPRDYGSRIRLDYCSKGHVYNVKAFESCPFCEEV
jgi:hypothetical protein